MTWDKKKSTTINNMGKFILISEDIINNERVFKQVGIYDTYAEACIAQEQYKCNTWESVTIKKIYI